MQDLWKESKKVEVKEMSNQIGKIFSVNISEEKGTIKKPIDAITIDMRGVLGDAHYADSNKHVSLIGIERINEFSEEVGREVFPGEFAENITTIGLDLSHVFLLDRFIIGTVEIEVIQIGKDESPDNNAGVFRIIGKSVMLHEGLFCRVISGGTVKSGDKIEYISDIEP
jgi:molybdopterin adenylyltransferase